MKQIKSLTFTILLLVSFMATTLQAQIKTPAPSPSASFEQAVGLSTVTVDYSRPSMKGRSIFGDLVPYDKIWRTGANQGSKITFSDAAKLNGKEVPAGTYTIYTKPGKSSWTVMLYKDLKLGGNVGGYDEANELARFSVTPQTLPFEVESMTFMVGDLTSNGANLYFMWEDVALIMPIEVEVEKTVMASIDRTMAGPSENDYYAAAVYYYENGKDMAKALDWINKSQVSGDRFWKMTWKARILAKMGKKADAIATSKKAMALAKEAKNGDYVKINTELIESLQ